MNKTNKRIAYLIGSIYAVIFTLIISGRVISGVVPELMVKPDRPTVEALSRYAGFNAIRASGDFDLEIVRAEEYAISYEAWSDLSGDIRISLEEENTLFIEGRGNTVGDQRTVVKIRMPSLQQVHARYLPVISISGFVEPELTMGLEYIYRLNLSNSRIQNLDIDSTVGDELYFTNVETETRLVRTQGARHSKARIVDQ